MAPEKPRTLGDLDLVGWNFPLLLRRALASQFAIWVLLRPVCRWSVSLSSSVGYGRVEWVDSQALRMRTDSLLNLAPILGVTGGL